MTQDLSPKSILLVEDEVLIAMAESDELRGRGYQVLHCLSGEEAVKTVRENPSAADLVLMDIDLGCGMDGTEAALEILSFRDVPVVFLSSHTEPAIVERTEKITSYGYIVKSSGITVIDASIKMAFKLFEEKQKVLAREEALRESEERFRSIFDNALNSIMVADDEGNCISVNDAAARLFGYGREELLAMNVADLGAERSPETRGRYMQYLKKGQEIGDFRFRTRAGDERIARYYAVHIRRDFNLIILSEITEQRRAEASLKRYKNVVDATHEGLQLLDREYRYVLVNDAYEKFAGKKKDEILGKTVSEYLGEDVFRNVIKERMDRCLNGEMLQFTGWFDYPGSGKRYVLVAYHPFYEEEGEISGVVAVTKDITELHEAETALSESEEKQKQMLRERQLILEHDPAFIIFKDTENNILRISETVAKMTGLPKEQIEGRHSSEVYPDMADEYYADDREVLQSGRAKTGIIEPLPAVDGTVKWLRTDKIPYFNDTGEIAGIIVFSTDISEIRNMLGRAETLRNIPGTGGESGAT
jgi:PAS domain S-box-containing protein